MWLTLPPPPRRLVTPLFTIALNCKSELGLEYRERSFNAITNPNRWTATRLLGLRGFLVKLLTMWETNLIH